MSRAPLHFAAGSAMLLLASGPTLAQQQGWYGSGARTSSVVSTPDVKSQPAEGWFGRERRTETERRARAAEAAPDLEISAGVGAASMPPPGDDYPVLTAHDAAPQSPPQPESGPMATAASEPQLLGGPDAPTSVELTDVPAGADGASNPWLRQGGVANYSVQREARAANESMDVPPPILVDPEEAARAAAANPPRRRALPPPPRSTVANAPSAGAAAPAQTSGRFAFRPAQQAAKPADDRPKDQGDSWRIAGFGLAAKPAPLPQAPAAAPGALAPQDQSAATVQTGAPQPAGAAPQTDLAGPVEAAPSLTHPPQRARRTTTVLRTFTSPDEAGG